MKYFLGACRIGKGRAGASSTTPRSIVRLMVEMLEPFKGRVYDPVDALGGMFVQSHAEKLSEPRRQNWRHRTFRAGCPTTRMAACKMNSRCVASTRIRWNNEGSPQGRNSRNRASLNLANRRFKISDWGGDGPAEAARWTYGPTPFGNANYGWLQQSVAILCA